MVPIEAKTRGDYYKALDVIFRHYNKGGFIIKIIYCDGEYHAMMNKVSDDLDVEMNYTNASDHVPEAEQNNHTIKERIRATFRDTLQSDPTYNDTISCICQWQPAEFLSH